MTSNQDRNRSEGPILRALRLIRLLSEAEVELTVKQTATELGVPDSTAHRLLQVFTQEGFVRKLTGSPRYRAGIELERVARLLGSKGGIVEMSRPFLEELVARSNEASMFVAHLPASDEVSVMAAINSSHPLRYDIQLFQPHSVAWGATGRSILAFLPEEEQRKVHGTAGRSPGTGQLLPQWSDFKHAMDEIRARGYAISRGEKISGAVGMGAPVYGTEDRVIGALCMTIPEMRFDPRAEPLLAEILKKQAESFSARFTGNPRPVGG